MNVCQYLPVCECVRVSSAKAAKCFRVKKCKQFYPKKCKIRNTHRAEFSPCTSQILWLQSPSFPLNFCTAPKEPRNKQTFLMESKQWACWAVCPQCIRTFIICLAFSFRFKQTPLHSTDGCLSLYCAERLEKYVCVTTGLLLNLVFKYRLL